MRVQSVRLLMTQWTGAWRATWDSPGKNTGVGCHALLQGHLPHPGIEPVSLMSPALADEFFTTSATWEAPRARLLLLLLLLSRFSCVRFCATP